eukprot:1157388-Pelagomonas_calceolata.AAC.9
MRARPTSHMASLTSFRQPGISPPIAPVLSIGSGMEFRTTISEYMAKCLSCKASFQCKIQNVKAHESGNSKEHAAAWQQAQKDKAAWQQRLDKGAKYTAQLRTGQAADP